MSWAVIIVAGGLGVMLLMMWFVISHVRHRRKTRLLAQLSAQYRERQYRKQLSTLPSGITTAVDAARTTPAVNSAEPWRKITVDELVARIEAEGLPVRLRWDERDEME